MSDLPYLVYYDVTKPKKSRILTKYKSKFLTKNNMLLPAILRSGR